MPVDRALIHDELAVNILAVDHISVAVKLIGMPLRAEGDEHRQRAEVIYMVENGSYAQRAKVGDYHRAMEGACLGQALGKPTKIVQHADDRQRKAEQEARRAAEGLGNCLGVVVFVGSLDFVDFLIHLAVDVEDCVSRFKVDLDGRLRSFNGETALDGHDDRDIIPCVDAAADNKAVDAWEHGHAADICRDDKVQNADALIALNT